MYNIIIIFAIGSPAQTQFSQLKYPYHAICHQNTSELFWKSQLRSSQISSILCDFVEPFSISVIFSWPPFFSTPSDNRPAQNELWPWVLVHQCEIYPPSRLVPPRSAMASYQGAYRLRRSLAMNGNTGSESDLQLRKEQPHYGFVSRVSDAKALPAPPNKERVPLMTARSEAQPPIKLSMTRHNVSLSGIWANDFERTMGCKTHISVIYA